MLLTHPPRPAHDVYRVLSPGRIGLAPLIGLAALVLSMVPLIQWVDDLAAVPATAMDRAALAPVPAVGLQLVVHIQDSGFFIEGADNELAPDERRIWCDSDRCTERDLRTLTARLATIKAAHPGADQVVFVAGMTVPFGRVQAAMDAARTDSWHSGPDDEPTWLFPRVTVQPDQLGQDRFLEDLGRLVARI